MFDELLRKLQELSSKPLSISIDVPLDEDGYVDRMCPAHNCRTSFKVLFTDWRDVVAEAQAFCPFCKHAAPKSGTTWGTPEQNDHAQKVGFNLVKGIVDSALSADARSFNTQQRRRPRHGFLDIRMSASFRPDPPIVVIPIEAANVLRQRFACERCSCRYASLGASFFCPACGHNSAVSTFDRTLEVVRTTVESFAALRESLAAAVDPDTAHDTVRQIREDQFSRAVGAFERFNEAVFARLPNASAHTWKGNVFQRIDEASALWAAASGSGYGAFLSNHELVLLKRLFQQRHVLGHCQGIVDQRYIDLSRDTTYSVGQRLVIRDDAVRALVDLISKLATGLRTLVP